MRDDSTLGNKSSSVQDAVARYGVEPGNERQVSEHGTGNSAVLIPVLTLTVVESQSANLTSLL